MEISQFNLAAAALDYCPPQNFSGMPLTLNAGQEALAARLAAMFGERQDAKAAFCVYMFGKEKNVTQLQDTVFSALIASCCDPHTQSTNISSPPMGFWERVEWLKGLYKMFREVDSQLTALKNYQPQNAIQLKNLFQVYYNVSKKQLCNLNAYQVLRKTNLFWRITLDCINYTRRVLGLNSTPKLTYEVFQNFVRSTYAIVGKFTLGDKNYEVQACVRPYKQEPEGDAAIDIAKMQFAWALQGQTIFKITEKEPSITKQDIFDYHHFLVKIGRYAKNDRMFVSEGNSSTIKAIDATRVLLIETDTCYTKYQNESLDEKLNQIMLEVMRQNERIEKIKIMNHRENAGVEIRHDNLGKLVVLNPYGNPITWKAPNATKPILHATGGYIPEYWSTPPVIQED